MMTKIVVNVLTGAVDEVALTADEIAEIQASSPTHIQIKELQWGLIKAKRDLLTDQGGYQVGTKWYHSDQNSRSQQLGLVIMGANIPAGLKWKTMDGSFVTMTATLAGQILAAGAASDTAIFAVAETHNAAMQASADPASYDFSTGWPATFLG
jgi:hypothetical protein